MTGYSVVILPMEMMDTEGGAFTKLLLNRHFIHNISWNTQGDLHSAATTLYVQHYITVIEVARYECVD